MKVAGISLPKGEERLPAPGNGWASLRMICVSGEAKLGVIAPHAHRVHPVRTVATSGQTPVNHPKMHPPKQPIEPQKTLVASTPPVLLGLFFGGCQYIPEASGYFLFFPGGLLTVAISTGRVPSYTQSLDRRAHRGKSALYGTTVAQCAHCPELENRGARGQ